MYKAPVEEILFTLKHVAGLGDALAKGRLGDLTEDLVDAIVTEAGRFATEEVAPLGEIGDKQGARLLEGHRVKSPDGWADLYRRWAEGGWSAPTRRRHRGRPRNRSPAGSDGSSARRTRQWSMPAPKSQGNAGNRRRKSRSPG